MYKHWSLFIFLFISYFQTKGQVTFETKVSPFIETGVPFNVSFELKNAKDSKIIPPDFKGFEIISGPNISSQSMYINGKSSSTYTESYILIAEKPGQYTIGSASVKTNNGTLTTKPITIEVLKSKNYSKTSTKNGSDVIPEIKVSKRKAYVGEQIMVNYLLYYGEKIGISDEMEKGKFTGFFEKPIDTDYETLPNIKRNGKVYQGVLIGSSAIFAQSPGKKTLSKVKYHLEKPLDFGFGKKFTVETDETDIEIKPLPTPGNINFSGAVGQYQMDCYTSKPSYNINESINLIMEVKGNGDVQQIANPTLKIDNFDVYPAKLIATNEEVVNNEVRHLNKFEFTLVPKSQGNFKLNPEFVYFDTEKEEYVTLRKEIPITIEGGVTKAGSANVFSNRKYSNETSTFPWYLLALIPLLGMGVFYFIKNRKKNTPIPETEEERLRKIREAASATALKKLKVAEQLMNEQKYNEFYKEIGNALNKYVVEKYDVKLENFNKESIYQYIFEASKDPIIAKEYLTLLEKADESMYAGFNDKNMSDVFEKAQTFIKDIELRDKL